MPIESSKTAIFRRFQVIKSLIGSNTHSNLDSNNNRIVERVLGIIDNNFNEAFLPTL